ncbi:light-harvesting protein [Alsobacter sp. R-9]
MNNAKIWLVVKPTVGIPLFLGAVASTSLFVHYNLLKNTTWLPAYYQGKPKKAAALDVPTGSFANANAVVVFKGAEDSSQAVVVLPDGRTARVVFDESGEARKRTADASAVTKSTQ